MHSRMRTWITFTLFALLIGACGSFEVGIEHIPPGGSDAEIDWRATAETLQAEATRRSNNVQVASSLGVAEPAPTLVPTIIAPAHQQAMVAYVQGGDIWVKSLPEGDARRLTHDGRNQEPRWSASGDWLSFVKNPDFPELWVIRHAGGDAWRIGVGVGRDAYAWSPMDDTLAYGERGSVRLYAVHDGAEPTVRSQMDIGTPDASHQIGKLAWSPSGQQIAFTLGTHGDDAQGVVNENDGLWIVDVANSVPAQVLASELRDKGDFILQGWSSDSTYLLFWQAPVRSASILADGVPLYRVPAAGGTPQVIAESVLPYEDSVQSQPNGLPQVAIVEGSGREMWSNKHLRSVIVSGDQSWELTPMDQAVASPVWSPAGDAIAYIGMPNVEGVGGGPEAQAALNLRQVWIIDSFQSAPHPIKTQMSVRAEAPQWIDDHSLLVAHMDADGRASLWRVSRTGDEEQQVVDEITPAPEWFGFYGHIRWQAYFSLWRPPLAASVAMVHTPTMVIPPTPICCPPDALAGGYSLANFLWSLQGTLTMNEAITIFGEPLTSTGTRDDHGNQLTIFEYVLADGVKLRLGFPQGVPLAYIQVQGVDGRVFVLTELKEMPAIREPSFPTPPSLFGTATPIPHIGQSPLATPTATPISLDVAPPTLVPEATATPFELATIPPPTPTPIPIRGTPLPPATGTPIPTVPMPGSSESEQKGGHIVHRVQEGETIMSIANHYGVAPETILAVNGLSDPAAIRMGDELMIPLLPTATPLPTSTRVG